MKLGYSSARGAWLVAIAVGCLVTSGCSLLVMSQKMLFGDPLMKSEFKTFTNVDLTKGDHTLLIVCSTREAIDSELSTLKLDLIDGITRQLKREGVSVIEPDAVATWIDDRGGLPSDPAELARDFPDADYIAWIDVDQFSYKEENSESLLRGRSQGMIKVYRVTEMDGERITNAVFTKEYTTVYPPHTPISDVSRSPEIFRRDFVRRVSDQLSHKFYDAHSGWDI